MTIQNINFQAHTQNLINHKCEQTIEREMQVE